MWRVNKIGVEQVWYSEEEYNKNRKLFLTCLKFINHLRENNCLDHIEIGNTSCRNCLDKIDLFYKLYEQYFGKDFDIYQEIDNLKEEEK